MLLRFQVSNHRSFLDPVEISMIAVDRDRPAARGFDLLSERVLTVAAIYGPNASGKSNLLNAIAWLSNAVHRSLRGWDEFVPRDSHSFGKGPALPSVFDIDLVVDGVRCAYRLEVDDSAVLYESVHSYPEQRRRLLFERHKDELLIRRGLGGAGAIQELLTPTTLALSTAMRLRTPEIGDVGRAIAGMRTMGIRRVGNPYPGGRWRPYGASTATWSLFSAESNSDHSTSGDAFDDRQLALDLIRWADPGINDVEIVEVEESDDHLRSGVRRPPRKQLRFVRRVGDEEYPLDYSQESAGTRMWFGLMGPALGVLRTGTVLLFDEIDASLHPRLSARLIELFQDPKTNPHGAQLVFTTHDTSLLNVLNRDEVWFTEKDTDGSSSLTALAEFGGERVRKSLNLERAYMQGRFGAIPEVDQIAIRDTLGLALQRPR